MTPSTLSDSTLSISGTAGGGITKSLLLRGDTKTISTDFVLFKDNYFHEPIFPLKQFRQRTIGHWKLE